VTYDLADMELRQLEYFVAVAEDLNFSRAATRLHVAQPSISAQIKALEVDLGVQLFERSSKAVSLTPAGLDVLPLARELLADARELREQAHLSARRLGGKLRIGFLADEYASPSGERVMAAIRRRHPRITVEFQQVDFAEHHRALDDGQVDVAFVMGPLPERFTAAPIGRSPRLLAASRALLEEHGDVATALRGQAVVLPNAMAAHEWRRAWSPPDMPPGQVFVVGEDSMESVLAAVGARRGVAVVPEYVSRFYPQPGVVFLALDELGPCSIEVAALRERSAEPPVAAFLEAARTAAQRGASAAQRGASAAQRGVSAAPPQPGRSAIVEPRSRTARSTA
jgi:DNA-binding transcriptional LysR family regulator